MTTPTTAALTADAVLPAHPARSVPLWLVLLALAMGGFAIGTTEFATMTLLPDFAPALGIDEPTAGHVISAYALGVVIGAPALAVLGARVSKRMLLIVLMGWFAAGHAASALAPSYGWMLLARFLSGLPHGAYFGVAALVAAALVPGRQRAQAVARVMLGLTVATTVGVPVANTIGQVLGWRWGFALVAALALATMALVAAFVPQDRVRPGAGALSELGALARRQVWLTLGIGAIGFGGLFAVYTYLATVLTEVTAAPPALAPLVFGLFGLGLTFGNIAAAWLADRFQMATAAGILVWSAVMLALFPFAAHSLWLVAPVVFLIGCGGGLSTVLQTRLMDVAGDAQTLAAALNHSAFNFANALGPLLGGLAIAAGWGWGSTGFVGCALALAGLAIWAVALRDSRR